MCERQTKKVNGTRFFLLQPDNTVPLLDSLKTSIEQRRVALAVQGLADQGDFSSQDQREENLKREIEAEKERYDNSICFGFE